MALDGLNLNGATGREEDDDRGLAELPNYRDIQDIPDTLQQEELERITHGEQERERKRQEDLEDLRRELQKKEKNVDQTKIKTPRPLTPLSTVSRTESNSNSKEQLDLGEVVEAIISHPQLNLDTAERALANDVVAILKGNLTTELKNYPERAVTIAEDIQEFAAKATANQEEIQKYVTQRLNA